MSDIAYFYPPAYQKAPAGSDDSLGGGSSGGGQPGADGLRGTQTYVVSGAPSNDLNSFTPPAKPGDLAYDTATAGGPYLYVLGN